MGSQELEAEDRGDVMWVGSVGPIPIGYDDDPRTEDNRRVHRDANVIAQALHSADELLSGLSHASDWVRYETIPRAVARWRHDPRIEHRLIELVTTDATSMVREAAITYLGHFEPSDLAIAAVRSQRRHPDQDVRDAAIELLEQWSSRSSGATDWRER
jgi:hypothetical protein